MNSYPIEDKIKLLLVMQGYKQKEIVFKGRNDNDKRYIKYDYWQPIKMEDLLYITNVTGVKIEEIEFDDEDCGALYAYDIDTKIVICEYYITPN